jgi:hypothetical protein
MHIDLAELNLLFLRLLSRPYNNFPSASSTRPRTVGPLDSGTKRSRQTLRREPRRGGWWRSRFTAATSTSAAGPTAQCSAAGRCPARSSPRSGSAASSAAALWPSRAWLGRNRRHVRRLQPHLPQGRRLARSTKGICRTTGRWSSSRRKR